jgi:hypothetical protein
MPLTRRMTACEARARLEGTGCEQKQHCKSEVVPGPRQSAIPFSTRCKISLSHDMPLPSSVPPALLCDGTKEELRMELQRRGTISFQQGHSVSKDVLKVMINMSIENEELKQELALAQKRPA